MESRGDERLEQCLQEFCRELYFPRYELRDDGDNDDFIENNWEARRK